MNRLLMCASTVALAASLSACGGGGGGGGGRSSFDAAGAIKLTGATEPEETVADQAARASSITSRADALVVSRVHGETTDSSIPSFVLLSDCNGLSCTLTEPQTGFSASASLDELAGDGVGESRAVLTMNGITLLESRGGGGGPNYRIYGAWLEHGAFAVETKAQSQVDDVTVTLRGAYALGDRTGSRPSVDATWRGLMVGTPTRGEHRDNILQGDAELVFSASENDLDATFSNIRNLDRNADHTVPDIRFEDVPVTADGTWSTGPVGNRIEGGFGGPDHAEAGGVFEQQGVVGAYGAKKQP